MEELQPYVIRCSCGAEVRYRSWYLHLQYGVRDQPHFPPPGVPLPTFGDNRP